MVFKKLKEYINFLFKRISLVSCDNRGISVVLCVFLLSLSLEVMSQSSSIKMQHKVKKKETIFGIANDNGLTIQELIDANPKMKEPGYELKKGDILDIPYSKAEKEQMSATSKQAKNSTADARVTSVSSDPRKREIRIGVMLPLHDVDGDGLRMTEYYRGLLMACDSIKRQGVSVDVHAWNVNADADISQFLKDPAAAKCDIIFGPLYTKQVKALGDFALQHDIKVVIPFSISSDEVLRNRNIFQIYQNPVDLNSLIIEKFIGLFSDSHIVFIDCNDAESQKSLFTFTLRRELDNKNIEYSITNLTSAEDAFAKAFSKNKRNVVVLNTGKSPELRVAIAKIDGVRNNTPNLRVSLFGYTDWLMYTKYNLESFYKYDTYIPSTFYYSPTSPRTKRINQRYRWAFHQDMMNALPRFAITGFDQGFYFLRGLHLYGKEFYGNTGIDATTSIQTPYHFSRNSGGGLQNKAFMLVHYKPNSTIETINY